MKKLTPVLIAFVLVAGIWFYASSSSTGYLAPNVPTAPTATEGVPVKDSLTKPKPSNSGAGIEVLDEGVAGGQEDLESANEMKPAADTYKSSEEALAAILKGAKDYDDSILEQFSQPGPDCSWCPELYNAVRNLILDPSTPQEQKSYLAEILAISGRVENVQTILDSISSAKSKEEGDVFAEALELTLGGDDVTNLLGLSLSSTNDQVRESSVAAITNQGSRLAAELLIQSTLQRGDPDGYYSAGIGIGEFIPNEEALPLFQEMVQRRDEYSHLGVKALINSGLGGLRLVFDELENTDSPEVARSLIKDALDHVNIEDGLPELANSVIQRDRNGVAVGFAQNINKLIQEQAEEQATLEAEAKNQAPVEN